MVEVLGHDAYHVRMDGSGRMTKRNRRFLRRILPYTRVLAGGDKDDVESKDDDKASTGSNDDAHDNATGVPGSGDGGAGGCAGGASSCTGLGAGGAAGADIRGTGRPAVLREVPSCVQGEVLDKPAGNGGPVLGTGSRRGTLSGSDPSDVTHSVKKYNLRPNTKKVTFYKE